jgi:hypothetical protein
MEREIALKSLIVGSIRFNRNNPTVRKAREGVNTREADICTGIKLRADAPRGLSCHSIGTAKTPFSFQPQE